MHGFKTAILEKLKNWQNGTFESMHEIYKKKASWELKNMFVLGLYESLEHLEGQIRTG